MRTSTLSMLLGLAAAAAVGGCANPEWNTQPLGPVAYADAFRAARAVMGQYFSVASADARTGVITTRPKMLEAAADRLLGRTAARQIAAMRVRQAGGEVMVDLRVENQRQDVNAFRQMQPITVDNEVPSRTSDSGGGITTEQNQAWQTVGRDRTLEATILAQLVGQVQSCLRPATRVTTAPATGKTP